MIEINNTSEESIIQSLGVIARDLLLNKCIRVNNASYAFIDLEVYYWHALHKDEFASGVSHYKPIGSLEAHKYGIDISLGIKPEKTSEYTPNTSFGGILICGLYDMQKNEAIAKPWVIKTLFNQLNFGDNRIEIIDYKMPWEETFASSRQNLGRAKTSREKHFARAKYKFLAKDERIFKEYKGKENVIRYSDLEDADKKILLGYELKS